MPKQKQKLAKSLSSAHTPVLLEQVLHYLDPKEGESLLDVTAGYGGHAREILKHTKNSTGSVLTDRDTQAVKALAEEFKGVQIIQQDFLQTSQRLLSAGERFDMILADLGISSLHLESAKRGFSFRQSGPLDMRMDQKQELTAYDIVNNASEKELADILKQFGQEPKARSIARRIVAARPIRTTAELATIVAKAWPSYSRTHPATRSFQAIRIAVNNELEQLEQSLPLWLELLKPGGRLAIISFHSLEDRLVKRFFAEHGGKSYDAELKLLTKKPTYATKDEIVSNPRARSAKLRAVVKIKTKERMGQPLNVN